MSTYRRTTGAPQDPHDDLTARIVEALHRRAADAPEPGEVADRLARALAERPSPQAVALRRGGRVAVAGVVTGALAVAASGAAAAANPYSGVAVAVESAAQTVGLDVSFMPTGYSREQHAAVESSGLTQDDLTALAELWQVDGTELKSRIGQAILDGEILPVVPGSSAPGAQYDAFWAAGYTAEDLETLNELWGTPWDETKLRAGQTLLDGKLLPIRPSGTPPVRLPAGPDDAPLPGSDRDAAPPAIRPDDPRVAGSDVPQRPAERPTAPTP